MKRTAYIDVSVLANADVIKGQREELDGCQRELRVLSAGIDSYPTQVKRLQSRVELLKKGEDVSIPLKFEASFTTDTNQQKEELERFNRAKEDVQKQIEDRIKNNERLFGEAEKTLKKYEAEHSPRHELELKRIAELIKLEKDLRKDLSRYVKAEVEDLDLEMKEKEMIWY